jgi:hypothetical protein
MRSSAEIEFRLRVSPRELPELMDGDCSYDDFRSCLRSLEQVNRWLLGYRPTMVWLKRLLRGLRDPAHHLEDEEIIALLRWMEATAHLGWFINDLQRSAWSCRMFGWMGGMVEWHRFVRHDGPVSFRRAFREQDWVRLLAAAEVSLETATVEPWRPGRLCVGRWK